MAYQSCDDKHDKHSNNTIIFIIVTNNISPVGYIICKRAKNVNFVSPNLIKTPTMYYFVKPYAPMTVYFIYANVNYGCCKYLILSKFTWMQKKIIKLPKKKLNKSWKKVFPHTKFINSVRYDCFYTNIFFHWNLCIHILT